MIIAGRNADKIKKAGEALGVTAIVCDVTNEEDIEALVTKVRSDFPELGVLVNNGVVANLYKVGEGADAYRKAKQEFEVNYFGPVLLTEKLLPVPKQQPETDHQHHFQCYLPSAGGASKYSDTKAVLHSHTVALRHTLAKDTNIKVYEVMPSLMNTDATKDMGGEHGMHP